MGIEIALIAGMMILTTATHAVGLYLLEIAGRRFNAKMSFSRRGLVLITIVLSLLGLHVLEIVEYAAVYRAVGAVTDFETALYFSGAVYSTIGAIGVDLPHQWRLMGSLEGVNGMVMIGWSTAYLFTTWQHVVKPRRYKA